MMGRTERLLEARRAVPADRQKSTSEAVFLTNARQPLAKGRSFGVPLGIIFSVRHRIGVCHLSGRGFQLMNELIR